MGKADKILCRALTEDRGEPGLGWRGKTKGQMLRKGAEAVTWALERAEPESGNFLVI